MHRKREIGSVPKDRTLCVCVTENKRLVMVKGMVDYKNRETTNFRFLYCSMINSDQYATHRVLYAEM